ncbi:4-hydroxybenzoate polyprenyl transferase [Kwoniella shandongensis]|uniref:4-hydroxybenzoate polyprenyltransferase, mitochondrial n=1 Tax=Kwoniella shandongensis TaxID=1734106 RepID=A0A5M6C5A5_9TREE|nr:4-hydroxybenzoate polyprenyl transferase [Kwoniella shandongensis]KAA5530183.1 4-hydroxybenzoate polyprenyl transferase [Kwoniella shandongensis]
MFPTLIRATRCGRPLSVLSASRSSSVHFRTAAFSSNPKRTTPTILSTLSPTRRLTTPSPPSSSKPPSLSSTSIPPGASSELVDPTSSTPVTTPAAPNILDKILPRWAMGAKPYLLLTRIDKPIGSILLFWPCAWSITMASTLHQLPITTPLFYLSLFALGSVVMRGAGCTINDMWDSKMDAMVERTKTRPIAAGDVTQFGALTFLGAQMSIGLAILTQLNWYSIVLGASSLSLVVIYPFMKRITYYPQVVLGLAFNWGAFLGWSAVAGAVDWTIATPMYVGGAAWCVMYDIIYAHQDKKDDVLAGVKSMALRFPDTSRTVISTLSASFVSLLTLTGHLAGLGPLYYLISCGGAAAHLAWQCATVNFDSRPDCWSKFSSNGYLGGLVWLGIAADYVQQVLLGIPA